MINRGAGDFTMYLVLSFILVLIVGIFFGWVCPIEGPIDYLYDSYASQPAINRPSKGVTAPAPKKTEIFEDFNEDGEPEWYQIIPLFEIE